MLLFHQLSSTYLFSFKYRKCNIVQPESTSFMLLLIGNEVKLHSALFAFKCQFLSKINRALIAFQLLSTFVFGSGRDRQTIELRLELIIVERIGCLPVKSESDTQTEIRSAEQCVEGPFQNANYSERDHTLFIEYAM